MRNNMLRVTVLIVVILSLHLALVSMTADEVLENMFTNYEKQMENIHDLQIISDTEVRYQKRATIDGSVVYKTRTEIDLGRGDTFVTIWDGHYLWSLNPATGDVNREAANYNSLEMLYDLKKAEVEYIGTDSYDGFDTHVLKVKDMSMHVGTDQAEAISGHMWVDAQDWIIRKLEASLEDELDVDSEMSIKEGKVTVYIKDYNNIEGYLIPFKTEIAITGIETDMTPEEREEMRQGILEMERELEQMPPMQRRMAEGMMGSQMETMKSMLADSEVVITIEVDDVKVNQGLADDLFDGNLLGQ